MFLESILQHGQERCVRLWLQLKPNNLAHPVPVTVPDAWVTEGLKEWKVFLELVEFHLEELRRSLGVRTVCEGLGKLVHCTPHRTNIVFYLFSIQLKEGTFESCTSEGGEREEGECH